ncbi:MAG TPA: hypothetical protein ENJ82_03840, partial [Bacteroidetes bacterium]|nr:hypothetical protein [Bacteroidota bacterium]
MIRNISFYILLAFAMWLPASMWGQAYSTDLYNEENGLPDRFVYTVTQDAKGFLWVGTGSGLYRFDGQDFVLFSAEDEGGPANNFTTFSLQDSKKRTWFGHYEGSLTLLEGMEFRSILKAGTFNSNITGIQEDNKGRIWLSSQRNGLVRLGESFEINQFEQLFSEIVIVSFAITQDNLLLIGTDEGLKIYTIDSEGNPKFSHDAAQIPSTKIKCIQKRPHHKSYWLGTEDEGLLEYIPGKTPSGDTIIQFSPKQGYQIENIQSIYEDELENVWVGTFGKGVLKYNDVDVSNRMRYMSPVANADS